MATFERKVEGGRIVGLTADLLTEAKEKEIENEVKVEEVVTEKVATPEPEKKVVKKPSTKKSSSSKNK